MDFYYANGVLFGPVLFFGSVFLAEYTIVFYSNKYTLQSSVWRAREAAGSSHVIKS